MPDNNIEALPINSPLDYQVASVGQIALELARTQETMVSQASPTLSAEQTSKLLSLTGQLIEIVRGNLIIDEPPVSEKKAPRPFPSDMADELRYLSEGYSEQESADAQGFTYGTVKSRRQRIKQRLGTRARAQTVVEAIQKGHISIVVETEPAFTPLSAMEYRILQHSASGRSAAEIASLYSITPNTVDRYYEEVRSKIGAKNMPHAIRRAFELGIFKIGEPIADTTELDAELRLSVVGAATGSETIISKDHREIELLRVMSALGTGKIASSDILNTDFYAGVPDMSRANVFGYTMARLSRKFEAVVGEDVISKARIRIDGERVYIWFLKKPVAVEENGKIQVIPEFVAEPPKSKIAKPKRTAQKAKRPKKPRHSMPKPKKLAVVPAVKAEVIVAKKVSAEESIIEGLVAEVEEPKPVSDYLDPDSLPPMETPFLESLKSRKKSEVLLNKSVKKSACDISKQPLSMSYRERLVLVLRCGMPASALNITSVYREGRHVPISEIESYLRPGQGLELKSASLLSGLTQEAILEAEAAILGTN